MVEISLIMENIYSKCFFLEGVVPEYGTEGPVGHII